MQLKDILRNIDYVSINGNDEIDITGICYDSRFAGKGNIFICIKGRRSDGHKYIDNAIKSGAKAIVVSDDVICDNVTVIKVRNSRIAMADISCSFYEHPTKKMTVIGVTGTNGKTTVTHLIKSILEMDNKSVGLIGTNEIITGNLTMQAERTTPESPVLQKWFREMVDNGLEYCVIEVSSHSIELERIRGTNIDIAVFTNLTHEHLDFHNDMDSYMKCKAKLFEMARVGIVNIDDMYYKGIIKNSKCEKIITYGIENSSNVMAKNIRLSEHGVIFDVLEKDLEVKLPLPGRFNVYNGLAAVAVALEIGVSIEHITQGLRVTQGAKGRAQFINVSAPYRIMIDYAHTPDGLYNILTTLREFVIGRIITVFGAPGDRDRKKRAPMGELVGIYSDYAVITEDNPASENACDIAREIEVGMKQTPCEYIVEIDREKAIYIALNYAKEGDIVLLAGKGHETYQIVGDEKIEFSEEEIVKKYFHI